MFKALSERYGWTPQQIARLTPAQVRAYLHDGPFDDRTGKPLLKFGSIAEARKYQQELKGKKGRQR